MIRFICIINILQDTNIRHLTHKKLSVTRIKNEIKVIQSKNRVISMCQPCYAGDTMKKKIMLSNDSL